MIFASSSEVYGNYSDSEDFKLYEELLDDQPIKQLNDYAISKWVNELQIINSAKQYQTKTIRVRFFNVYGPGEYFNFYRSAICRFIFLALKEKNIYVHKNQIRQSLYIDDCIDTLINIIDNFKPGEVYNLSGLESHSMEEVFIIIREKINYYYQIPTNKENIIFIDKFDNTSVDKKYPICNKAIRDLKHNPKVNLEEGIKRTIKWMKGVIDNEDISCKL